MDDRLKHILGAIIVSIFQSTLASDGRCRFKLSLPYWLLADGSKWIEYESFLEDRVFGLGLCSFYTAELLKSDAKNVRKMFCKVFLDSTFHKSSFQA